MARWPSIGFLLLCCCRAVWATWANVFETQSKTVFYIYDEPVFRPHLCHNPFLGDYYTFFYRSLLLQLYDHPWRTLDPKAAELFVVPMDVDLSHDASVPSPGWRSRGQRVDRHHQVLCDGAAHSDRLAAAIAALRASPYYQRSGGADHFWGMGKWRLRDGNPLESAYFPHGELGLLANMTIGHFMNARLSEAPPPPRNASLPNPKGYNWYQYFRDYWRCTVSVPVTVAPALFKEDESYEEWRKRPINILYRGKSRDCYDRSAAIARNRTLEAATYFPGSVIERGHAEEYVAEIRSAKFCLVLGCDNPQTSRFMDAIAAGCIPVTIDNGHRLVVAPFARLINYDSFSIDIQEALLIAEPVLALSYISREPETAVRELHRNLMAVRSKLLYVHPESDVATWVLIQLKRQCTR